MHFIFIAYGMREWVEKLLRDMSAQKHYLRMWKEGEKDRGLYMESQIRILPFGVYEYIFPKEDLDLVLAAVIDSNYSEEKDPYLSKFKIAMVRKMLKAEKIPEFKRDKKFLWMKKYVAIVPIGIKHDGEITEEEGEDKGFTHERI
jgi:hypothetical protein